MLQRGVSGPDGLLVAGAQEVVLGSDRIPVGAHGRVARDPRPGVRS